MEFILVISMVGLVLSLFFTDNRIVLVNIFMWFLTICVLGAKKYSGASIGVIVFYLFLLILTCLIEAMFLKIDAVEERKYGKFYWICCSIVLAILLFATATSPKNKGDLLELAIGVLGVVIVTFMFVSLIYELCFIYIFVPISMLFAKREKLIDANLKGMYKRGPKNRQYFALKIKNYTSKDFLCNKKTEVKFENRKKDIKTIEVIKIPLFNRIIIPNI